MNGVIVHEGFCTTTDADGDQFYGQNKAKGPLGEPFLGEVTFTGGTGKYAGIQGTNSYRYAMLWARTGSYSAQMR